MSDAIQGTLIAEGLPGLTVRLSHCNKKCMEFVEELCLRVVCIEGVVEEHLESFVWFVLFPNAVP